MDEKNKIQNWIAPIWHADFGNSEIELAVMKSLCVNLFSIDPNYKFELDAFEEGYICVNILYDSKFICEAFITSINKDTIGLFLKDGGEFYTDSIDEAADFLKKI